jgi:transcriptional regulator of heat shock response
MKRAYTIKIYGKAVKTVGGDKAGRFYSNGTISHSSNKNALENARKRNRRISNVFRPINKRRTVNKMKNTYNIALDRFKICFCLILLTGAIHSGYIESHKTIESTDASDMADTPDEVPILTSFESADIPAGYKEPDLFDRYFGKDAKIMRAICKAESGMQDIRSHKMNKNGTYDWGRCQINDIHAWRVGGDITKVLDPETNIKIAKSIYDDRLKYDGIGWTAWSKYNNGEYLKHL